jgi:hypothetical protein
MLNVATEEPGAKAVLDGKADTACTTPCSFQVTRGRHTLTLSQAGFHLERREVTVESDSLDIRIPLRPVLGTVMLSTDPPGATVTVDGKARYGQTPLTLQLPPGPHVIVVTKEGLGSAQKTVQVEDDTIHREKITITQR